MDECPVRPGTYVRIPPRKEYEAVKQPRRKIEQSPEEQVAVLRNQVHWLSITVVALLATSVLLGLLLVGNYLTPEHEDPSPMSQNYVVSQTEE